MSKNTLPAYSLDIALTNGPASWKALASKNTLAWPCGAWKAFHHYATTSRTFQDFVALMTFLNLTIVRTLKNYERVCSNLKYLGLCFTLDELWNFTRLCRTFKDFERPYRTLQDFARLCRALQTMQDLATLCRILQGFKDLRTLHNFAELRMS